MCWRRPRGIKRTRKNAGNAQGLPVRTVEIESGSPLTQRTQRARRCGGGVRARSRAFREKRSARRRRRACCATARSLSFTLVGSCSAPRNCSTKLATSAAAPSAQISCSAFTSPSSCPRSPPTPPRLHPRPHRADRACRSSRRIRLWRACPASAFSPAPSGADRA